MKRQIIALILSATLAPLPLSAQLIATGAVTNGHHHFNASDIDEHMRFWVDTLGGTPGTFGNGAPIVLFPNALIFMRDQDPTGGTIGSTVNHVGFSVQNLRETVDKLVAAGYEMVTSAQAPPGTRVVDDIGIVDGGPVSGIAYVVGPDGIKVEVLEMKAQEMAIVSHHIHFFGEDAEAMRAWYMDVFGASARPGRTGNFIGADLPGLGLNFTPDSPGMAGTAGRALDHIGFEIDGLEAFTRKLEAKGIALDVPYREVPAAGLAIAFITDPWGTYIELTEGLDAVD
jgi:catechol 2,3-dioxygenase-like lactoylglutathione lyase family enzyme